MNVFQGGFLGMDNIGIFDRAGPLPVAGTLVQSESTSWMAMYCPNMLRIAIELAQDVDAYQDIATKFFEFPDDRRRDDQSRRRRLEPVGQRRQFLL
jgi:hypothetical protein